MIKYKSEKTVTLTIASVKPAAADDDYDWLQGLPVYIYKEESPDWRLWYSHDPIRGFDEIYEEGYEYVVKVRRLTLAGRSSGCRRICIRIEKGRFKDAKGFRRCSRILSSVR